MTLTMVQWYKYVYNQSVDSAGVAFVKGAKIKIYNLKKKIHVYDEQAQAKNSKDEQVQGRTYFGMNTVRRQSLCVS